MACVGAEASSIWANNSNAIVIARHLEYHDSDEDYGSNYR